MITSLKLLDTLFLSPRIIFRNITAVVAPYSIHLAVGVGTTFEMTKYRYNFTCVPFLYRLTQRQSIKSGMVGSGISTVNSLITTLDLFLSSSATAPLVAVQEKKIKMSNHHNNKNKSIALVATVFVVSD